MDPSAGRLKALQSEIERLTHYLTALPPDAWNHPSACARWQVADVVAHLAAPALYPVCHGDLCTHRVRSVNRASRKATVWLMEICA